MSDEVKMARGSASKKGGYRRFIRTLDRGMNMSDVARRHTFDLKSQQHLYSLGRSYANISLRTS